MSNSDYLCPDCTKRLDALDEDTRQLVLIKESFDVSRPGRYSDEPFLTYYEKRHHRELRFENEKRLAEKREGPEVPAEAVEYKGIWRKIIYI